MEKIQFTITIFVICLSILISGCGTTSDIPVLEKNAYYQKVGPKQATRDIELAISEFKSDVKSLQKSREEDLETTVKKGAVSSAAGTLATVVTGRAALGIITGSGPQAYSKMKQKEEDNNYFRENVARRLRQKGYQIKRWK